MDEEPIRITGIYEAGITQPRNDGTAGSALYTVPLQLSRRPSADWAKVFVQKWDRPSKWTSMHRPGIARVSGDKIYLEGTTLEEIDKHHRETLRLAIEETNEIIAKHEAKQREATERERADRDAHQQHISETAKRIKFD